MTPSERDPDLLCVNAIRFLAADAVEKAKSGHPGMPMGMAPAAYLLWREFLRYDPADPLWPDRDRFILSAGHGSMLLYAILHLTGYDLSLEDLMSFRQWESRTPGHPERGRTPGVEVTTGPLGQGISNAVGMALAERKLAAEFNRGGHEVVEHRTWVIASDGDMMEGVSGEASSLAGTWELGKLNVLYDNNHISIDGSTALAFHEDVNRRYEAYGWHTQSVEDGNDLGALRAAFARARDERERPSLIRIRTHIGFGSPKQDSAEAHGEPLGEQAVAETRRRLDWPYAPFEIPAEVYERMEARARGRALREAWQARREEWGRAFPDLAREFARRIEELRLPDGWDQGLPDFAGEQKMATRVASAKVLAALSPRIPELLGGSADLTPSARTQAPDMQDFSRENPTGRYIHYGVREHAMGAILNGLGAHQGYRAYGGTFLIFSDYMRPAIRLSALSGTPATFVYTHDSIALGEDGPTHQPVGQLMGLRAMPGLWVIRPADAGETVQAWKVAVTRPDGPVALVLTRQNLPVIDRTRYAPAAGLLRGGYVLRNADGERAAIVATGSEVQLALGAQDKLAAEGIPVRVVSLPCWELFAAQDPSYQAEVLPRSLPTVAVEAGATLGWDRYADSVIGLDHFGASAPGEVVYRELGFTVENVVAHVKALLG